MYSLNRTFLLFCILVLAACSSFQVRSPESALAKSEVQLISAYSTIASMKANQTITAEERDILVDSADKVREVLDDAYILLSVGRSADEKLEIASRLLTALLLHLEERNGE